MEYWWTWSLLIVYQIVLLDKENREFNSQFRPNPFPKRQGYRYSIHGLESIGVIYEIELGGNLFGTRVKMISPWVLSHFVSPPRAPAQKIVLAVQNLRWIKAIGVTGQENDSVPLHSHLKILIICAERDDQL